MWKLKLKVKGKKGVVSIVKEEVKRKGKYGKVKGEVKRKGR